MIKSTVPRRTQEINDNGTPVNKFQTGGQEHMMVEHPPCEEPEVKPISLEEKKAILKVA
jgi:hypothetical protein